MTKILGAQLFTVRDYTRSVVKWYLVERDAGPTEALESLRISYNHLRQHGFA